MQGFQGSEQVTTMVLEGVWWAKRWGGGDRQLHNGRQTVGRSSGSKSPRPSHVTRVRHDAPQETSPCNNSCNATIANWQGVTGARDTEAVCTPQRKQEEGGSLQCAADNCTQGTLVPDLPPHPHPSATAPRKTMVGRDCCRQTRYCSSAHDMEGMWLRVTCFVRPSRAHRTHGVHPLAQS